MSLSLLINALELFFFYRWNPMIYTQCTMGYSDTMCICNQFGDGTYLVTYKWTLGIVCDAC